MKRVLIPLLLGLWALTLPGADQRPNTRRVLNGIDVLRQENFEALAGKRIGLITNHTGLAADGATTIDLLFNAKVCTLTALFSPEHGIRGILDSKVGSSVDEATSLPIHSLYGETRRPTAEMLRGIDALVFDVQDIGARFFTYITTMAYCMEEAAKAGIPFYVLDRPNPIGGVHVEGPMLDADKASFVGYMPLPVRHGMTVGELAQYFNLEKKIGADLKVIKMKGWSRSDYLWDTGQLWVDPSPNMRSMPAALLYPGVCLLEDTNVSVGRGTDRPFEIVGAPWIEPRTLAAELRRAHVPGVRFVPLYFTPKTSVHRGVRCGGVNVIVSDAEKLHSVHLGLAVVSALRKLYPDAFEMTGVVKLLGNEQAYRALEKGSGPFQVIEGGRPLVREFLVRRQKALIYDVPSRSEKARQ